MKAYYLYELIGKDMKHFFEKDMETYKDLIKNSDISCYTFVSGKEISVNFLYDPDENLLHTEKFKGRDSPLFSNPITPEHLLEFLEASTMILQLRNTEKYDHIPHSVYYVKNYPQMITELELAHTIKTKPSKSMLADDPRKFYFVNEESEEWEVDCLGTGLCSHITAKVEEEWEKINKKNP